MENLSYRNLMSTNVEKCHNINSVTFCLNLDLYIWNIIHALFVSPVLHDFHLWKYGKTHIHLGVTF